MSWREQMEDERYEARMEARRDEIQDRLEASGWTCSACGEMFDPIRRPATRVDPGYVERDSCPSCGGDPVCDEDGCPIMGRIEPQDEDEDQ
jgi:rubrerythrin